MIVYYLLENDALSVRGSSEGVGLPAGSQMCFLVIEIGPSLDTTILHVLPGGPNTCGFTHFGWKKCNTTKTLQTIRKRIFSKVVYFYVDLYGLF